MNKELADIQDLKSAFISHCKELGCDENYIKVCENKFSNIETALNRLEGQDQIIDTIKETIEFDIKEPEIEVKENSEISLLSKIGMILRKELNEKERKLFRNWVLKECFPKELKALKIIKAKKVNVGSFIKCCANIDYEEYLKGWSNWKKDILYNLSIELLTKEEYDLLKEVLY